MQKISRSGPQFQRPHRSKPAPLKIVFVYDGFANLIRVHEIWAGLVTHFKRKIRIVSSAWSIALLRDPRLRQKAGLHTVKANMVVISAVGRGKLPDHVRNWIGAWVPWKKRRGDALVAVLEHQTRPSSPVAQLRDYLRQTAEHNGMDFLCNAGRRQPKMEAAAGF